MDRAAVWFSVGMAGAPCSEVQEGAQLAPQLRVDPLQPLALLPGTIGMPRGVEGERELIMGLRVAGVDLQRPVERLGRLRETALRAEGDAEAEVSQMQARADHRGAGEVLDGRVGPANPLAPRAPLHE